MDWVAAVLTVAYLELFRRQRDRAAWWVCLVAQGPWTYLLWHVGYWPLLVVQALMVGQCVWALAGAQRRGGR